MKKLMGLMVALSAVAAFAVEDSETFKEINNSTEPGYVLQNNHHYTVVGHVVINAKSNPGQSALRLAPGTGAIIYIPAGTSLTVIGGDGEGQVGAGAGIEVPPFSKLIVRGEGTLTAIGGNAAPGVAGHNGSKGRVDYLIDTRALDDEKVRNLLEGKDQNIFKDIVAAINLSENLLTVGYCGAGGAGGEGGGGAAAAIGGKGGRGGDGGVTTVSQPICSLRDWSRHSSAYNGWFHQLGYENPFLYDYMPALSLDVKRYARAGEFNLDGRRGADGKAGGNGQGCGEIIIAESVQVKAVPGQAAAGGRNGRFGKAFARYDDDEDSTTLFDVIVNAVEIGVDVGVTIATFGASKAAQTGAEIGSQLAPDGSEEEDDDDDAWDDEEDEKHDSSQKIWYYGGGGGAGGAGGGAALAGIGPGGAGGGGGGAGGSGMFLIGSFLGDCEDQIEVNGYGGRGGQAFTDIGHGTDASEENEGESEHIPYSEDNDFYNWRNGEFGAWSHQRDGDNWAHPGAGGAGGAAGAVNVSPDDCFYLSPTATVTGFDPNVLSNRVFSGNVACTFTYWLDGDKTGGSEKDYHVCGTLVDTCVVPVEVPGKVFEGYYTKPNGQGVRYFDCYGIASGFPFVTGDVELFANYIDEGMLNNRSVTGFYSVGQSYFSSERTTGLSGNWIYRFTEDVTVDFSEKDEMSPVGLGSGAKNAILYIPEGVTVTFIGSNAHGQSRAYPGIRVESDQQLIVTGGGRLIVKGGDGGDGAAGGTGQEGYIQFNRDTDWIYARNGKGGDGGAGGGGGAPGIGGVGGFGAWKQERYDDDYMIYSGDEDSKAFCKTGYGFGDWTGNAGGAGTDCGDVFILGSVQVSVVAGSRGSGGAGGAGGAQAHDSGSGFDDNHVAGGGGGGGGGAGGGAPTYGIGGGGGAGGGGGQGGQGSLLYDGDSWPNVGGGGGAGGNSPGSKSNGGFGDGETLGLRTNDDGISVYIASGAQGGAAGANGGNGTFVLGTSADVGFGGTGTRQPDDYAYGNPALERTITLKSEGRTLGTVRAMLGERLPTVILARYCKGVTGWDFAGAYLLDSNGKPVEDELGFYDYWYDEFGEGLKAYDAMDNVTLEVALEPKWDAMAWYPGSEVFEYDGRCKVGVEPDESYEIVGGTASATNAGVYAATIRLAEGYEIWSDFLEEPDLATNSERTVIWAIQPANLDVWFPNQTYDWKSTNNALHVGGDFPRGTRCAGFTITKALGRGDFEVEAAIDGGSNYISRTLKATYSVPEAVVVENVVSWYPWDTKVEIDFELDPEYAADILATRKSLEVSCLTQAVDEIRLDSSNRFDFAAFDLSEAALGYGTLVVDMKDAIASGRQVVPVWISIDGVPASEVFEVAVDTTAVPDGDGVPVYTVENADDIFPLDYSWRFGEARDFFDGVLMQIGEDDPFEPIDEDGFASNEGDVRWRPEGGGSYVVYTMIGARTVRAAIFNLGGEKPATCGDIVAIVNAKSEDERRFTSLEAAVDALEYGDTITVIGDVQLESAKVPSGTTVILGHGAKFRDPRPEDLRRDYHEAVPILENGSVVAWRYQLDEEKVRPVFAAEEGGNGLPALETADGKFLIRIGNAKEDLFYTVHRASEVTGTYTPIVKAKADGDGRVSAEMSGDAAFYKVSVTDDPAPLGSEKK